MYSALPNQKDLCRDITTEEIETYERDGVVCLRQVVSTERINKLLPVAKELTIEQKDFGLLPTYPGRYMARTISEFREFVFESSVAEAAAKVMRSKTARFFFDEIFAKSALSNEETIWHVDRMGWPTVGKMVPSIWIPLTAVSQENSLECIAESHHQDVPYWLFSPNARQMVRPDGRASHPDGEKLRADPNNRFLSWDMQPGDLLIVHPWTLHYSHGNTADDWRIALSVRVFGDDIRWQPRPDCLNIAGVCFDEMIQGEQPAGSMFPLLWSADGSFDDDSQYPRGFATTWNASRKSDVNEYEEFKKQQASQT